VKQATGIDEETQRMSYDVHFSVAETCWGFKLPSDSGMQAFFYLGEVRDGGLRGLSNTAIHKYS
jgi:hypothetical protein